MLKLVVDNPPKEEWGYDGFYYTPDDYHDVDICPCGCADVFKLRSGKYVCQECEAPR